MCLYLFVGQNERACYFMEVSFYFRQLLTIDNFNILAGIPQHLGKVCLPNQPMVSTEDLPWLVGSLAARKARFKFWTRTMDRARTLRWLLVNSFPDEYIDGKQTDQLVNNISEDYPLVFPIGPLSKHAVTKNPSFWEEDTSCLDWLDRQNPNSVVYISFGSWVNPIGDEKVKNLALALEESGRPFIWVNTCSKSLS
jgi:hypothetical protein